MTILIQKFLNSWHRFRSPIVILLLTLLTLSSLNSSWAGSLWDDFASPVTTKAAWVLYPGAFLSIIANDNKKQTLSKKVQVETQEDTSPRNRRIFHVGDLLGSGILNGGYALAMWLAGEEQSTKHMASASLNSTFVTWVLKLAVREKRPAVNSRDSFPSGHSSLAFAFGTVVALRHNIFWGTLGVTTASFISYSRIIDNRHWLHDVIAGATIGASYAIGTYISSYSDENTSVALLPTEDMKGFQATFVHSF
jgi:membrane-associated phospholipid phosphatase